MTRTLAFALLLACDTEPPRSPPPVAQGRAQPAPATCGDYQACTADCATLGLGAQTTDARIDCVESCEAPRTRLGEDLILDWAYSCARIGRTTNDICADGLTVCEHLEIVTK